MWLGVVFGGCDWGIWLGDVDCGLWMWAVDQVCDWGLYMGDFPRGCEWSL